MAVTQMTENWVDERNRGLFSETSSERPAPERGEDSECRPKPGQRDRSSIARRSLLPAKRYSTAARCLARMTSTPAPTAIAATNKPPAMAAEVPKAAMPAQAMRAAPSKKSAAYMSSSPEWLWSGALQFGATLAARQSGHCDRGHMRRELISH